MSNKKILYVGGVGSASEDTLSYEFGQFGFIRNIQKQQKGDGPVYAFVEFENEDDAAAALDNMNGSQLEKRTLTVHYANSFISLSGAEKVQRQAIWNTGDDDDNTP